MSEGVTIITGSLAAAMAGLALMAATPIGAPDVRVYRGGKLSERPIGPSTSSGIAGRASVIDGDTIEIRGQRIRLWGIDAPEGRQRCHQDGKPWRCGTEAANALAAFLGTRAVSCMERGQDRYRRIVAVCSVSDRDIGAWLVRNGWALDYRRYSNGAYAVEEGEAAREKRGIWQGEFVPPWEWRHRK